LSKEIIHVSLFGLKIIYGWLDPYVRKSSVLKLSKVSLYMFLE